MWSAFWESSNHMPALPPVELFPLRQSEPRSAYRHRTQTENAKTQEIVIAMARRLNVMGSYILVHELEARSLFSRADLNGKRVLEVGCGTLPITMAIPPHKMPCLFVASDVNLRIVKEAQRLDSHPHYVVFSALDPAIKPGSMDYIVLNGVLHHLPPECDFLDVLRKLLAPDGRILMLEPNVSCGPGKMIKWILKRFFRMSMEASPHGQFSNRKITWLVTKAMLFVEDQWFASVLAFPLTGGQGRCKVMPDSRHLFRVLVALDEALSRLLHLAPLLARFLHWRVLYLLARNGKSS